MLPEHRDNKKSPLHEAGSACCARPSKQPWHALVCLPAVLCPLVGIAGILKRISEAPLARRGQAIFAAAPRVEGSELDQINNEQRMSGLFVRIHVKLALRCITSLFACCCLPAVTDGPGSAQNLEKLAADAQRSNKQQTNIKQSSRDCSN